MMLDKYVEGSIMLDKYVEGSIMLDKYVEGSIMQDKYVGGRIMLDKYVKGNLKNKIQTFIFFVFSSIHFSLRIFSAAARISLD